MSKSSKTFQRAEYWRERNHEVDFVVKAGRRLTAIEVKSGRAPQVHRGMAEFAAAFRPQRSLLLGGDGIALDEFLGRPVTHWIRELADSADLSGEICDQV
jgi:hypothetical protein